MARTEATASGSRRSPADIGAGGRAGRSRRPCQTPRPSQQVLVPASGPAVAPLLYTPAQAIVVMGLRNMKQFYRLVEEGEIPTIRLGRLLRVPVKSLEAHIARQCPPRRVA